MGILGGLGGHLLPPVRHALTLNRGVNLGNWLWPPDSGVTDYTNTTMTDADFTLLKAAGVDHVRLPIAPSAAFTDTSYTAFNATVIGLVDQVIHDATRFGMSVIVDCHPHGSTDYNNTVTGINAIWTALAGRYKDYPANVVYELLNEPFFDDEIAWATFHANAIDHIRSIDPVRKIIIDSQYNGFLTGFDNTTPFDKPNLIYSFHYYSPYSVTHQSASFLPPFSNFSNVHYPTDPVVIDVLFDEFDPSNDTPERTIPWNRAKILSDMHDHPLTWATNHGLTASDLYVGEGGCYQAAPSQDRVNWYTDFISCTKELGMGFGLWTYIGDFPLGPEILALVKS